MFSKILIFWVVRGIKGQKTVQNDKRFCLSCCISHGLYMIWLWFMVHMCQMIIAPGTFSYFFKILIFQAIREVKFQKTVQNDKSSVRHPPYLRNHISYDCHLWYSFVKWQYLQKFFSFFQNFDFSGFSWWGWGRAKNGSKWQQNLSVALDISGTIHHIIVIYGANL